MSLTVSDKLNVPDLEDHVQGEALCGLFENLDCLELLLCMARDQPRLHVSSDCKISTLSYNMKRLGMLTRLDKVRVIMREELAVVPVEDRFLHPAVLTFRHFPLAVKVPVRLGEQLRDVRPLCLQGIPEVMGRHYIALAALLSSMETKQTNNVGRVRVEELPRRGRIDPHLVDLRGVVPDVLDISQRRYCQTHLDMAQNVSLPVLTQGPAEDGSDTEIDRCRLLDGPLLRRQSLDQGEPGPIDYVIPDATQKVVDLLRECEGVLKRQHRIIADLHDSYLVNLSQVLAARGEVVVRFVEQLDLSRSPMVLPNLGIADELIPLPDRSAGHLLGESCVRLDELGKRLRLTRRDIGLDDCGSRAGGVDGNGHVG